MSIAIVSMKELDGTLRYDCGQDIGVRVGLHQKNGHKTYPVELLHQGTPILSTDCNLRDLRTIENLRTHADALHKHPDWHAILTAVARELPEQAHVPWIPVGQPLSAYTITRREYLWYPWLLKGEPCSIEGDPNVGKTALLIKLLAHLTTGRAFPTLFPARPEADFAPATVVLFTTEDSPDKTLHPRLVLNGGDATRVIFMRGKQDPGTGAILPMTLQDLALFEQLLEQHTPAMLCFDPMQSYLGPGVDMNQAGDTRPLLDAVAALCAAHGTTPLYVRHHGKTVRSKTIHSALGSIDITGHLRSVLTLFADPDEKQRRILAHTKKAGVPAPSMQVRLTGAEFDVETDDGTETIEECQIDWDGLSDLTSDDLNARESVHGGDTDETNSALEAARDFLREMVKDSPVLVDELSAHAKKAGVSEKTLRRAKDKDHVKARRRPQDGIPGSKWPWEWYDPRQKTARP
jgi:putative DNA primase/helicase